MGRSTGAAPAPVLQHGLPLRHVPATPLMACCSNGGVRECAASAGDAHAGWCAPGRRHPGAHIELTGAALCAGRRSAAGHLHAGDGGRKEVCPGWAALRCRHHLGDLHHAGCEVHHWRTSIMHRLVAPAPANDAPAQEIVCGAAARANPCRWAHSHAPTPGTTLGTDSHTPAPRTLREHRLVA